ncbi:efflux RND transporter permease subunit [Phyllobacterium endophyticum]|jgi:multidrug efflux pump|uniref:Multidrug efflux protein n=1 Tax=Phyllobacterium endophyticum TaxID=1149773 RepID=A0A2P7AVR2_9HYPH|nr:efflux RND transporter permease subunit [Phyllobacterium endophyticum]MBB3234893.1 multidrug efflux pump [Phyllobacterium endophyticum]PSH58315.1 multidrug efflux protein [Phyllobacterium endophyticum]TXR50638.1 MMPL family transporter [Phyllobacterium endophyticum]TYR38997.1 MMPL family transporter [Phyllobacterium endophyticum]
MNFSDIFIRRPVLSTVVALMIILLGAQGLVNLSVRQYPKVEETVITIKTAYAGASADLMQGFISAPIAKAVTTTENIDYVTSSSAPSSSTVTVQMKLGANPDAALTEVISKVNQVRGDLPEEADDPVITKGTGQDFATMYLAVQNPNMTSEQITEYLERVIQPRMSTIQGVADAQILGGQVFSMRVWIDPIKLAARKTTASEVLTAINQSNFLSAPGKIENLYNASPITLKTTLQTPEAFGAMPIKSDGDNIIRLRDVARVELGAVNKDTIVSFNGSSGTFLGIFPTPAANPIDMTAAVRKELPSIQASLPEGMRLYMVYDSTEQISSSIEEVFKTIGEAVLIVVAVILLFLGSFRSVIIPVVTIPISLIGVCFFLFLLGYSINLLSLLAMVLAIGLVVDDAIVVLENIHRHIEEGLKPFDAALKGMREITGPIVAMTITLAAVFAPLGFTGGLTGSLFREFAFTLAGAVIISGVAALTVSPMMCALLLRSGGHSRFQRIVDRSFGWLEGAYERRVAGSLNFRFVTLFTVIALVALTGFLLTKTNSELAPEEDSGALFAIVNGPQYATSQYTKLYADQIDALTKDLPELKTRFNILGFGTTNSAFAIWVFKDWSERTKSQAQLKEELQGMIGPLAGVEAFIFAPPDLPGTGGGLPISIIIQSTGPADKVFEVAEEIKNKAQASGQFIIVQNSLSFNAPQVTVTIDRDRASALGVPVSDIGQTLGLLVGGGKISKFDRDSNSYDIIPQVPQDYRSNPENLGQYFVKSASGEMVPLSAVIKVTQNASPAAIEQFNQLNSATISALPLPGVTTGQGLQTVIDTARPLMPDGFFMDYSGQSRLEIEQGSTILIAFMLAVVVIYLVLAAQFESFRDPFIIMMSVPLSIFGAIVPLNLGLGTLNIYTQVGLITLVGLITKHGILMVEFANQQRELHGVSRHDAIILAAKTRLRPILMTTAAMALGVIPLITATGAGAAARYSIGLVIFSGIIVGTIFTLFVVPMFYTFISKKDEMVEATRQIPDAGGATPQVSHT